MPRRNRVTSTPQRRKSIPVRVERMLAQVIDDTVSALVHMSADRSR